MKTLLWCAAYFSKRIIASICDAPHVSCELGGIAYGISDDGAFAEMASDEEMNMQCNNKTSRQNTSGGNQGVYCAILAHTEQEMKDLNTLKVLILDLGVVILLLLVLNDLTIIRELSYSCFPSSSVRRVRT